MTMMVGPKVSLRGAVDDSRELLWHDKVVGWISESGPRDNPYVVKVYGFHPFTAATLTQALRMAGEFIR